MNYWQKQGHVLSALLSNACALLGFCRTTPVCCLREEPTNCTGLRCLQWLRWALFFFFVCACPPHFVLFCFFGGWGFVHTTDICHTETQMEEMLLLTANGLQLTAHQESITWVQSRTHLQPVLWCCTEQTVSIFVSKMFTKVFPKTHWEFSYTLCC